MIGTGFLIYFDVLDIFFGNSDNHFLNEFIHIDTEVSWFGYKIENEQKTKNTGQDFKMFFFHTSIPRFSNLT